MTEEHDAAPPASSDAVRGDAVRGDAVRGDAVQGRTEAEVEEVLGETGALPEESAEEDPSADPAIAREDPVGSALRAQIAELRTAGERLRGELAAAKARADEERAARARIQADFENFRRRMQADQARWQDDARKGLIDQLLESDDDFERALLASGDVDALKRGVELARRRQQEVYRRSGLEEIEVGAGTPFDPKLHEAVASVPSAEYGDGQVVKVERRGYTFRGILLRPALVTVAEGLVREGF